MSEEQKEEYWRIQWDIAITDDRERKLLQRLYQGCKHHRLDDCTTS